MGQNLIYLITDYQDNDEFAGILKASILKAAGSLQVIDLTHKINPGDIFAGYKLIERNLKFLAGSTVVAVVDPTVGSSRDALAVKCVIDHKTTYFVGPDNGLLTAVYDFAQKILVINPAVRKESQRLYGTRIGSTFDGRDLFALAGAKCALGTFEELGTEKDLKEVIKIEKNQPVFKQNSVVCQVNWVDVYGNTELDIKADDFLFGYEKALKLVSSKGKFSLKRISYFDELKDNELGLLIDSYGYWAIVQNKKSAAKHLNIHPGEIVTLEIN